MNAGNWDPLAAPMLFALAILLTGADMPVKYARHDGYRSAGIAERDKELSCLTVTNRKDFDDRFATSHFGFGDEAKEPRGSEKTEALPHDAFETRMVVAVVRRGNALWTYQVQGLSADGDKLTLRYKAKKEDTPGTTFACPLVVSVPKGAYRSVAFVEDGKEVGKASLEGAGKP